ncbi:MAG: hypothetical protein JWQ29_485 [Phenylobacterium sp.]|nr:hypothetical protein [Phenylobacterium sp.]
MRTRTALRALVATAALAAAVATAAPAAASGVPPIITLSSFADPDTLPAGQQLIADFNNALTPDAVLNPSVFHLTLTGATVGFHEGYSGYSGTLYNDPTHYLTLPGGATADLTSTKGLKFFSLYMGSPDTYNSIRFLGADGYDVTVPGTGLVNGDTNQSWSWGKRVSFDFGDARVDHIILASSGNSFEVDNFAGGAVPEPATWGLMIMGFGALGAVLRRRRAAATTFA